MAEMMNENRKWCEKEPASKGVANTALGLSIGALGTELLNGNLNLGKIFGGNQQSDAQHSEFFSLYKGYTDSDSAIIAKHNADAFSLYKYSRDNFDTLQSEISELKTKVAVQEAVNPWKDKAIYDAINLEAERRMCGDNKIVNYANQMFYPVNIMDLASGTTSTQRLIFNPLCGC